MRREERSWAAAVLTAFILVGVICVIMAAVKSCRAKDESSSEAPKDNPSVVAMEDTSSGASRHLPLEGKAEDEYEWEAEFREQIAAQVDVAPARKYIGRCRITVYNATESSWGYQTATGRRSEHLATCAVDPSVIPYGSNVILICADGSEWRLKAIDRGAFSGKWVDVFFDGSELGGIGWLDECFGGEFAEVYIEEAS